MRWGKGRCGPRGFGPLSGRLWTRAPEGAPQRTLWSSRTYIAWYDFVARSPALRSLFGVQFEQFDSACKNGDILLVQVAWHNDFPLWLALEKEGIPNRFVTVMTILPSFFLTAVRWLLVGVAEDLQTVLGPSILVVVCSDQSSEFLVYESLIVDQLQEFQGRNQLALSRPRHGVRQNGVVDTIRHGCTFQAGQKPRQHVERDIRGDASFIGCGAHSRRSQMVCLRNCNGG